MAQNKTRTKFKHVLTGKKDEKVLPEIRAHVVRQFNAVDPTRDMSWIHVSEMTRDDWCARRAWLRIKGESQDNVPGLSWGTSNIFQEGNYIQQKYEDWFWEMGVLWGEWRCIDCGHKFFATSPPSCEMCDGHIRYNEVPFISEEHHISGHIDAALMLESGPVLIEIKSVGLGSIRMEAPALYSAYEAGTRTLDQLWVAINRPFPSHRKQGGMYLTLAPDKYPELSDVQDIVFIYEFKANQEVKEFSLGKDKALEEVQELLDAAREVEVALRRDKEILRPNWANPEGAICSICPMRTACWGEEVEPGERIETVTKKSTSAKRRKTLGAT